MVEPQEETQSCLENAKSKAFQRLVLPKSSTAFLSGGLHKAGTMGLDLGFRVDSCWIRLQKTGGKTAYSPKGGCKVLLALPETITKLW